MSHTDIGRILISAKGRRFPALDYEDREEICAVLYAYGRLYDDNRIEDFVGLLTDDAVFYPNWPGIAPEEVRGRAALAEFFGGWRDHALTNGVGPHHYATNVLITKADGRTAEATLSMLYAESADGTSEVKSIGQYDYSLVKLDGRWYVDRWSMRYDG